MRIAVFTTTFPAISQTFVLNQVTGLLDRGHDVRVFCDRSEGTAEALRGLADHGLLARTHVLDGGASRSRKLVRAGFSLIKHMPHRPRAMMQALDVRRHGAEALSGKAAVEAAFFLEQRFAPDVIYCHFGPNGLRAQSLRAQRLLCGKLVTVFHAYDLTRYVREHGPKVYERLFRQGDIFLPITEYAATKLRALGCPADRIRVHPMGIDCDRFSPPVPRAQGGRPFRVLSVGRMVEKKGFDDALVAVRLLSDLGVDVRYTLIGDGPLRGALERQVAELALDDRVTFLGARASSTVCEQMQGCDVFLAPSVTARDGDEEGLPVVLMEALAMGRGVVSTRHAAIPELIEDGCTGLLASERDPQGLAQCLARLERDRALLDALGACGRERAVASHSIKALNARLDALLTELCMPG